MILLITKYFLMPSWQKLLLAFCLYFIYINIYATNAYNNLIFCMTEDSDITNIAEAKTTTEHQSRLGELVERNFDTYISDRNLIAEQKEEIDRLTKEVEFKNEVYRKAKRHYYFPDMMYEVLRGKKNIMTNSVTDRSGVEIASRITEVCEKHNKPFADVHPILSVLDNEDCLEALDKRLETWLENSEEN